MDAQGNWKELAAQKEREWKEVTELRYYEVVILQIFLIYCIHIY